jgi:hypothetical protein
MALQLGDVPVGLGKMLLFLRTIHGFAPTTRSPGRESPGLFLSVHRRYSCCLG